MALTSQVEGGDLHPMSMSDPPPVDPELFRVHAGNLEALRSLVAEVRLAREPPGQSAAEIFGPCGWIVSDLADRYAFQQGLLAYLDENLRILVRGLRRVADGELELKELILREEPDVATRDGTPVIENEYSLSGLTDTVLAEIEDREWVEPELLGAAPVAEFVAPVDPLHDALRVTGLQCAMACVEPTRQLLDDLTGTARVLMRHAELWHLAGDNLLQLSALLRQCVREDLPREDRLDVRSYQALIAINAEGLSASGELSQAVAVIVEAAADLVLLTRDIIRGVIGELVAQTVLWMVGAAVVTTRSATTQRLATVVVTCWRIHAYLCALRTSIGTLSRTING